MDPRTAGRRGFARVAHAAVLAAALVLPAMARAQAPYDSPQAAAQALVDALASYDDEALARVLGRGYARVLPPAASDDRLRFLEAWARGHDIVARGGDRALLGVGGQGWTLPIPIVRSSAGWHFDLPGAREEMRIRRIGRNELAVMQVLQAYVDAQQEYRERAPDGVAAYAQRAVSHPGRHDGLYWPTAPGEPPSPLGPALAQARAGQPYHGYRYRLLMAQGPHAPGGARSYLHGGRLSEGHALLAWPAKYGDTGVMSFLVNQQGRVHQRDLGPRTDAAARALTAYDPGPGWEPLDAGQ